MVLNEDWGAGRILLPRGHEAVSGDIFGCDNWGAGVAPGIYWVEAKDAVKHSHNAQERPHPTTKKYLTPRINSAKDKKPCC